MINIKSLGKKFAEGIPFSALRKQSKPSKKTKKRSRSPSRKRKRTRAIASKRFLLSQ